MAVAGTSRLCRVRGALRRVDDANCLAMEQACDVAFGPGTVGLVIEKYLASPDYTRKAAGTQRFIDSPRSVERDLRPALLADLKERHIRQLRSAFPGRVLHRPT